nr:prolyl oligopeptidase family [uncultured bacterium]
MRVSFVAAAALLLAVAPAQAANSDPSEADWRAWAETASNGRFAPAPEKILADAPLSAWGGLERGDIIVERIRYPSDGLQVTGFIVRPKTMSGRRPVLIWARGGIGNVEQDETQLVQMASWVQRGYIVIGSNFRGSAGSEGRDEFAGADVDDLVALLPLIGRILGEKGAQLYGIGFSRGGTMLLRAAAGRIPFSAIATAGAVTDVQLAIDERPDLGKTLEQMMPDYATERANRFCGRSAVCWPDRITAPVLIAQGGADDSVSVDHSMRLAKALERAKKPYRLVLFGGGNHPMDGFRQSFFDEADRLFRSTFEDD